MTLEKEMAGVPLDEEALKDVRYGRNKLLAGVASLLFGIAFFGRTQSAWALCGDVSPCFGGEKCCCCSGTECCQAGCFKFTNQCPGGFNNFCWNHCSSTGTRITCCDWINGNGLPCICRENTGSC